MAEAVATCFEAAENGKLTLFVPLVVVMEVTFTLRRFYKWSPSRIAEVMLEFFSRPGMAVEQRNQVFAALTRHASGKAGFADCLLCETALAKGKEILTFDKDFLSLEGIEAVSPFALSSEFD